jgi:hypothetical protein
MFENQMMDFIIAPLRKQGLSQNEMMSHGWRYTEAFMAQNSKRLREEGLILDDPDDPDASMLSGGFVTAVATARYDGVSFRVRRGSLSVHSTLNG